MKTRALAALAACLAAPPALAQVDPAPAPAGQDAAPAPPSDLSMRGPGPMGGGMGMLRRADANGDGVVTRAEYQAAVDARFDRLDTNGDGLLSPDEMPMRGGPRGYGRMSPPPAPDGAPPAAAGMPPAAPSGAARPPVTRDQYRAIAMRRFDRLDANGDGRIDAAEMAAERPGPGRRGPGGPPPGAE